MAPSGILKAEEEWSSLKGFAVNWVRSVIFRKQMWPEGSFGRNTLRRSDIYRQLCSLHVGPIAEFAVFAILYRPPYSIPRRRIAGLCSGIPLKLASFRSLRHRLPRDPSSTAPTGAAHAASGVE